MAARAESLKALSRTSPKGVRGGAKVAPATLSEALPESSGGLSLYDILTIPDLNHWTGLDNEYLQMLCRTAQLPCVTSGGGRGKGHRYLVMRKDFVEWWDRQQKGHSESSSMAEVMAQTQIPRPRSRGK